MTDLEAQGRMARLLISVPDPLCLNSENAGLPPLILGAYVRVEMEGNDLANAVRVTRTALRDGNNVWILTGDNTLAIRPVTIELGVTDAVYVTGGLEDGESLITSDLATPVAGMALRTQVAAPPGSSPGSMTPSDRGADGENR
jgi:hypothetical protein